MPSLNERTSRLAKTLSEEFPDAVPPEEGLERLRTGNTRFVAREAEVVVQGWRPGLAKGQSPFAVVLGCSDSRAPAELVFDQGLGDLFMVRIAGNVVAPSGIGSVEFAAVNFGTRLVVVMGHTHCGAISATAKAVLDPNVSTTKNLRAITDRIQPHIEHLIRSSANPTPREVLREAMRVNVRASLDQLRHGSQLIEELVLAGRLKIVGAEYDLDTGKVEFLDVE